MYDTLELWTEKNIIFGSSSLIWKVIGGKGRKKYTEALRKYQFSTPTP